MLFGHCPFLESISLPEDIKEIPSRVFSDCAVLDDSLRLPEKLETVGEGAFSSPNLTITYFPAKFEKHRALGFLRDKERYGDFAFKGVGFPQQIPVLQLSQSGVCGVAGILVPRRPRDVR